MIDEEEQNGDDNSNRAHLGEDWRHIVSGVAKRGFHFQVCLSSHPEHRMTYTKLISWAVTINILQVCVHLLTAIYAAYTLHIAIV